MTLQEVFIGIGIVCALLGILFRGRGLASRGLSSAFIIVGIFCAIIGVAGRQFGLW